MSKQSMGDRILIFSFYAFLTVFAVACLMPFWLVVASSLSDERSLLMDGYLLIPKQFSLEAYNLLLKTDVIFNAYKVTIFMAVVGTALSLVFTSAIAYALSVKTYMFRTSTAFFVYFTMLFSGGLVPSYILISKYLHMKDTLWVLIIPALINPWNMFLLRNFFSSIPESLSESAKIDGANDIYILFKIILPVSLPALATIGLFYALGYWNEWFRAMLYISNERLFPLQYLIMRILRNINFANEVSSQSGFQTTLPPAYTTQMATAVVTIGPIIFLYPFLQKYFVKGLMVGSIKG